MSGQDRRELLALGGWQGHDEFKKTVAAREDRRRADDGMGRIERQRARRSAKVFDGSGGMVVLHAELDQIAGERVKTALCATSTKMLGDDIAYDPMRTPPCGFPVRCDRWAQHQLAFDATRGCVICLNRVVLTWVGVPDGPF